MVDFRNLIDLQLEIFLFMALGYFFNKKGIVTSKARKSLTDIVIYLVLPANIIYSFMIEMNMEIIRSGMIIFLVSLGIQIFCDLISRFIYPGTNCDQQKVLKYATICSNAGFMGSPLVQGIYGAQGLLYASIYLIPQRIVMWSIGIACFSSASKKDVVKKVLTHPCIIAVVIGMILMMTQMLLPSFLVKTITATSNCNLFLSMIVIGGILAEIDFRSVLSKLTIYFSFLRLIIIPCIVLVVCVLLHLPPLVCAVASVLSGMPAGTTTAILAEKYDCDASLAVRLVFLSTILSLFTIPMLCLIVEWLVA